MLEGSPACRNVVIDIANCGLLFSRPESVCVDVVLEELNRGLSGTPYLGRCVFYMRDTMMPDRDNSNGGRRHFGFADVQVTAADGQWDMVYRDRRTLVCTNWERDAWG